MRALMWFRADLRRRDNTALHFATQDADAGVLGVFTICPTQWISHDWANKRVNFMLRQLRALSDDLAGVNIPLKIIITPTFAEIPDALAALADDVGADALYYNHEYEVSEAARNEAVTNRFETDGRDVQAYHDQVIVPPGDVLAKTGGWYSVFAPFRKAWTTRVETVGWGEVFEPPGKQPDTGIARDDIPVSVDGFDVDDDRADLWKEGEGHAASRLRAFIENRLPEYADQRNTPAVNGTSTVSPYLTIGILSPRQCLSAALEANRGRLGTAGSLAGRATVWISELIWREFYKHLLVGFPRLSRHEPYRTETRALPWNDDDAAFAAWCDGRTGFPIVDAAMRQLNQTGWMHNRLRMIVAMFLTKDLFIDWRRGEQYFMRTLVDGDLAANNGGWQWSASTGTDAAPFFRIFNPISQSKKGDPDGAFIRKFVPELKSLSDKAIHEPWMLPTVIRAPLDYPARIVDHVEARERVLIAFKALT
jgi:deoxyribodipyrimidine photo-lyase